MVELPDRIWSLLTDGRSLMAERIVQPSRPSSISSQRADVNPTSASSVEFTVPFSEFVVGVNAADFSLTTTGGISGASVTNVSWGGHNLHSHSRYRHRGWSDLVLDVLDDDSVRE